MTRPVVIVGAGLSGSLMALLLARRGHDVEVYERRPDPRLGPGDSGGRSFNLGMSARGLRALERAGLSGELSGRTVPMRGRMIHRPDRPPLFQPYGVNEREILHSVRRSDLNRLLIERAEAYPGVRFFFGAQCTALDRESAALTFSDQDREWQVKADFVIGADGAFSKVRRGMQAGRMADYRQEFLPWGYKELTIPPAPGGGPRTELEALHLWPAEGALIVAHPNYDNSLTCALFLPHDEFDGLTTPEAITGFFGTRFPDTLELIPDLVTEFTAHPVGQLVTIRTAPWHHDDTCVLIGDACHAVYPFYGQGMNSAFEDCLVLDESLRRHEGDRAAAFREYERLRRPHTDVLADLSVQNFVELRDRVRSPVHLARRRADLLLNRLFPRSWVPLYTMISHTTTPYAEALRRAKQQDDLLRLLGWGLAAGAVFAAGAAFRRISGARKR
ncbi:FAD-dependent oxidoreductase [Rhizohabitans arisaemae]|uniref:FAD-dependent oxidoreductase n=1 Tax=Rhizohabitans arisaemae TaxID=2720610 RepID=UPI0024B261DA|nr:NAD(P)/FAD-dependent oxidoreductase [Rhizohabitans arisaemae]